MTNGPRQAIGIIVIGFLIVTAVFLFMHSMEATARVSCGSHSVIGQIKFDRYLVEGLGARYSLYAPVYDGVTGKNYAWYVEMNRDSGCTQWIISDWQFR
jgi:hypothetical protein